MDRKDVQIGDFFTLDGRTVTVAGILENLAVLRPSPGHLDLVLIKDLKPVVLTSEMLEKFGFRPMKYEDSWKLQRDGFSVKLFTDEGGMIVVVDHNDDGIQKDGKMEVHVLQHALRYAEAPFEFAL